MIDPNKELILAKSLVNDVTFHLNRASFVDSSCLRAHKLSCELLKEINFIQKDGKQ